MHALSPYLTFNGNCREAMTFYQQCLGGELFFETVGDNHFYNDMPAVYRSLIVTSTLVKANFELRATDLTDETLHNGNAIVLFLRCGSELELRLVFERLSSGGLVKEDLKYSFGGSLNGELLDKFGKIWRLQVE